MKSTIAFALILILCFLLPARAQETLPSHSLKFYGHVNPTLLTVDDGVSLYADIADNANSGGRLGFWYETAFGENTLKFNGEISLGVRSSASLNQISDPPLFDWDAQSIRKFEFILETPRFGKFSVGQGSMGSDGVTESDLSGTTLASYVGISDVAGGYFFRTSRGTLSTTRVQDAYPTFDGGRSQRVRYDSPDFNLSRLGKLNIAASIGKEAVDKNVTLNDALSDVGVFYRNQIGDWAVAGSAGASIADTAQGTAPQFAGSFSVLHEPSGLNLTAASGSQDNGGDYNYAKIGLRNNWFNLGDSAVSIDWYQSKNTVVYGSRAQSVGIGVLQHLSKQNLDVFIGLRRYSYDGGGSVRYRDITSAMIGVRWVFRRLQERDVFQDIWQN